MPGFGRTPGWPELNWDNRLLRGLADQLGAIRNAVGPDMGIHLDINFNFKTEGFKRIAETVAPFNLTWLEIDTHDAPALAEIKRGAHCPIASCETLHGRREFKPFFDNYATDVAIIDVIWNGLNESLKIAVDGRCLRGQRRARITSTAICAVRSAQRSARSCRTSA